MNKYEFKTVAFTVTNGILPDGQLNEYGQQGWQAVSVQGRMIEDKCVFTALLMREVQDQSPPK